jgi:hypothetical protein
MSQPSDPPIGDTRLSVHTLLREDIFAGYLDKDMTRFARGEKNIDLLLARRPDAKSDLLAWKGGAALYRAAMAGEANRQDEFKQKYKEARNLFIEANKTVPLGQGVDAITGGSYGLFADRLPKENQAEAWEQSYKAYLSLYKKQSSFIAGAPEHFKGEVLGGLTTAAFRTGRIQEANTYVAKMVEMLKGTSYEAGAIELQKHPDAITKTKVSCITCHDAGRLNARLAALPKP